MNTASSTVYQRRAVPTLRILIGVVFAYAGLAKLWTPAAFAENVASFGLLPPSLNNLMAIGLPPFEIILGLLLAVGWRRRTMAFCALVLNEVLFSAVASAWLRGTPVACGCFGSGPGIFGRELPMWSLVGRDLLLLAATALVYADACELVAPPASHAPQNETAVPPAIERPAERR